VKREKGQEGKKNKAVKTFSKLAHPLTNAYAYQCGLRVRAHSAPSAAMYCPIFQSREPMY